MKFKNRKSMYVFIPLGLIIKLVFMLLLLNLPEGCRKNDDSVLKDIEAKNFKTDTIFRNPRI
jgi:hypothetical protein